MADSQLLQSLLNVIQDFETNYQTRLQEAEDKLKALEAENNELRQQREDGSSIFEDIKDEALKKRLASSSSSHLDALVREAGVVFENRLRAIAGETSNSLHGVALVDAVLAPNRGILVFSEHEGEQDGARLLYRGAMQFIRNPAMHNLIEYRVSMATILIGLIDSLLNLLSEAKTKADTQVKIKHVRYMLTRRLIPEGQKVLYQALYSAGDKGLSNSDLTVRLGRTRLQLAGILGALGARINNTPGLENMGGILAIFEVAELSNGDYLYRMRPVLREALELEKVV
jgi:hypothetical protein